MFKDQKKGENCFKDRKLHTEKYSLSSVVTKFRPHKRTAHSTKISV